MADPLDLLTGTIRPRQDDTWTTLASLAQAVASIPERRARAAAQRAEMEAQQLNAQTRAGELQFRQQALQQQDAAKAKMAQMDQAVNAIVSQAMVEGPDGVKRFDRKRIMEGFARVGAPLEVQAHTLKALDDVEDSGTKLEEARRDHAARVLNAVLEAPDTEQAAMMGIATGKANGWLKDAEAEPLMALLASGEDPKPRLKQLRDTLSDKYRTKHEVKDIGPGHQLIDEAGQVIAENPLQEKPAKEATAGSFEDFILRKYGPTATPAQILEGRKLYGQADDRPPVNIRLPSGLTPGQALTQTRQLRNEYQRETKSAKTVNQQLAQMRSSIQAVRDGKSPAGSQGVLVTFQKILDPTSVVRESEYARSASGLSLLGRIEGAWDKIKSGGAGVSVKDLEQFVSLAEQFAKSQNDFAAQSKAQIDALAKEYGLKSELITSDPGEVTGVKATPKSANPFR